MLSQRWQDSSKKVRMLCELITQWVFEDFEIRAIRKNLADIRDWIHQLHMYLQKLLPESENKTSVLEKTAGIFKTSKTLLEKYEGYYLTEETARLLKSWKETQLENPKMMHQVIEESLQQLLEAMIGNVSLGNYPKQLLYYCYHDKLLTPEQRKTLGPADVRGEVLYIQNLSLEKLPDGRFDMDRLTRQFLGNRDKNRKLNKFVWHQSFSFPPGEKPSVKQIREIVWRIRMR